MHTGKANAWVGWYDSDLAVKLQSQTMFNYEDASDNKLEGYTLFDLAGSYKLPVGSLDFGIQNLLDKGYTTAWGQRANRLLCALRFYGYTFNYQVKLSTTRFKTKQPH